MNRLCLTLLACAAVAAAERESAPVKLREAETARSLPRITFPQARFSLTAKRPKGAPKLGKDARYALARLGGRLLPLAFDAPEGAPALGRLHGDAKEPVLGRARQRGKDTFFVDFTDARCGGLRCNVRLAYKGFDVTGGVIEPALHRRGRVTLGGAAREVILIDADGDGSYAGAQDRWIALRVERLEKVKTLRSHEALLLGEPQVPFEKDGRALMVKDVAKDGSQLTLVLDKPTVTVDDVLQRRYDEVRADYFGRFLRERADFVAKAKLDTGRKKVKKAASWPMGTLLDARDRAGRSGKPLLVLYITESNPWCFRYEYYTFVDAEVDALLQQFVRVRIDVEKDPEKSFGDSGARGLPTLLPMTRHGKPVTFTVRHRDADGNVSDLKRPEKHITGWQRPRELAENLRRILAAAR